MTLNTEESPLDSTPPLNIEEQICGLEGPMQLEKVLQSARRASDFLKALAHETRLLAALPAIGAGALRNRA